MSLGSPTDPDLLRLQTVEARRMEALRLAVAVGTSPAIIINGSVTDFVANTAGRFDAFLETGETTPPEVPGAPDE